MKMLPILLINLVVTGGALVIYDQMQGESRPVTYGMDGADPVVLGDIESRLMRLEEAGGGAPALAGAGSESILRRLEALEQRPSGPAGSRPRPDAGSDEDAGHASTDGPILSFSEDGDVSDDDVRRVRKLMDAANEQRRLEREREQLARLLERLEIRMDDKQQEQYLAARRDRQEKMGTLFRNLRRGPDVDREQMMQQINEGRAKLNEEFATTINKFLPSGDAAKLAEHESSSRWGGMARGGDRGGDRGARRVR